MSTKLREQCSFFFPSTAGGGFVEFLLFSLKLDLKKLLFVENFSFGGEFGD